MMKDFRIVKAIELNRSNISMQISEIFVDGFYQWLKFFSKDKQKLILAFEHIFNLDAFYVALFDDQVVGIVACSDLTKKSVLLQKKQFQRNLGFIMGTIAYFALKNEFETNQYPFEMETNMGSIEFVAVSSQFRKNKIATKIITHILSNEKYREYVLEVADTNNSAFALYQSVGFQEFTRKKMKYSKQSGINYLVYMKIKAHFS